MESVEALPQYSDFFDFARGRSICLSRLSERFACRSQVSGSVAQGLGVASDENVVAGLHGACELDISA